MEPLPDPGRRMAMVVRLASGQEFRGETVAALPTGRDRTLDYLNGIGSFFQLVFEGVPRLFNRAHVSVVRPLD
jgi:hypothetical protein